MKKSLLFSIGMIFSLYAGMTVSQALMTSSDETILENLFSEAGVEELSKKDSKELESLAGNTELPFNNLYLYMLQNIMHGPRDAAIAEVAELTDYTEDEIEAIVLRGSTEAIISRKKKDMAAAASETTVAEQQAAADAAAADFAEFEDDNEFSDSTQAYLNWYYNKYQAPRVVSGQEVLTTEAIIDEYNAIVDLYMEELAFQEDNRQLSYEAFAQEMFMNGKLDDSANIDILYDLDLINYLLFGDYITYPDRSPDVDLASEDLADFEEAVVVLSSDTVDPYTCTGDEDLVAALETYAEDPPDTGDALPEPEEGVDFDFSAFDEPEEEPDDGEDDDSGDEEGDEDDASSPSEQAEEDRASLGEAFAALESMLETMENLGKSDWTRSLPCEEVFCITVEFITDGSDPEVEQREFGETENCIACHLSFVKKRLEETMSKSLVPSKISMNWFEDATCKEGGKFINLDLNVYAIKKPIDLDPGDDLDEKPNEAIEELKTQLFQVAGFPLPGGSKTTLGKTLGKLDCESLLNLTDVSGIKSSLDEKLAECQAAAEAREEEVQEIFEEFKFDSYSQSTSDLFGQVSAELYTMMLYFQTFQEGLKATYETEDAPLTTLLSKGYCE